MAFRRQRLGGAGATLAAVVAVVGGASQDARPSVAASRSCDVPVVRSVVHVSQQDDLARLVASRPPRTGFCLAPGIHRLRHPIVPKDGDVFVGRRGAVLSGARVITRRFRRDGDAWVAAGQRQQNTVVKGTCRVGTACRYADDVFVDGRPLRRVLSRDDLAPGRFFFDYRADRIWLGADPAGHRVEAAVVTRAFRGSRSGADDVRIAGLIIEGFANEAQIGAINGRASWTVERCEVRLNHGIGIQDAGTMLHNDVHDNGQLGVGGDYSTGGLVAHNRIHDNNYAGFDGGWEAGGGKWLRTKRLTLRANVVGHNDGPGLWLDTDNIDTLVVGNRVVGNAGPGIFQEISYRAEIADNVVLRNGRGVKGWVDGAGILISGSRDVTVHGNRLGDNGDGIGLVQTNRGSGRYGRHVLAGVHVVGNDVSMLSGNTGIVNNTGERAIYTSRGNRFAGNRYVLGCNTRPFAWRPAGSSKDYSYVTVAAWRAAGNDRGGRFVRRCRAKASR